MGYPIICLLWDFKGDFINMQAKISLNKQFLDPKVDTAHAFNAFQISITTDWAEFIFWFAHFESTDFARALR